MDGRNEFREGLFPSGQCIDPDEQNNAAIPEVFNAIDHGRGSAAQFLLARDACANCIQLTYCEEQRDDLATELWRRGAGFVVVGGEQKQVQVSLSRPTELSTTTFTFDLTKIPDDPRLALDILRQGKRSGQLPRGGRAPNGAVEASATYLGWLEKHDTDTFAAISGELGEAETTKGAQSIIRTLFQQKDFADFSQGIQKGNGNYNRRYKAENIDTETDYPKITQFLQDAMAIKQLGYSGPVRKAGLYSPAFYKELAETYQKGISWTDFNKIVTENTNPVQALQKDQIDRSSIRQTHPGATETYIRAVTKTSNREELADAIKQLASDFKDYSYVSEGLVRAICTTNPGNPRAAVEGLIARVENVPEEFKNDPDISFGDIVHYARSHRSDEKLYNALKLLKQNIETLTERYGDDPEITPKLIRDFSNRNLNGAVAAVEKYKADLEKLANDANGALPPYELRRAAREGITSVREAHYAYKQRSINNRFQKRAEVRRPDISMIGRIARLYPRSEIDTVAENVHRLMNNGVLVQTNADATVLHGKIPEELHKIFSPKANMYLTFSTEMRSLSHLQRLALAHQHGLVPLVYGCEANPLQLESLLNGRTIAEYCDGIVMPLVADRDTDTTQALSLSEIINDFHYYQQMLRARNDTAQHDALSLHNVRDARIVVGGHVLYLSEPGYKWDWDTEQASLYPWLEQKIVTAYAPHQREAAFDRARNGIQSGVLELLGDSAHDFRLVLSQAFYKDELTDLERAAVANAMGLDQLLFGSDLSSLLRQHFGDQPLSIVIERADDPLITEVATDLLVAEAQEEARAEEAAKLEALPLPDDPFERLLTFVYGPQPNLAALGDKQRQQIAATLVSIFGAHMKASRDQGDGYLEAQQDVFMAWSAVQGNDLRTAANTYDIPYDEIDDAIYHGLEVIGDILANLQNQRLADIHTTLEKAGTFVYPILNEPETTPETEIEPESESTPAVQPVQHVQNHPQTTRPTPREVVALHHVEKATAITKAPIHAYVHLDDDKPALKAAIVESEVRPAQLPAEDSAQADDFRVDKWVIIPREAIQSNLSTSLTDDFFSKIGRYSVLDAAEEVELAKAIEAGLLAQEKLDTGTVPNEERADYEKLATMGEVAKQKFIHHNLRLVAHVAKSYRATPGVGYMDYVQEGYSGLVRAIEKFDYTKGIKFSTYAIPWLRQTMHRARSQYARTIYTPEHIAEPVRYLSGYISKFTFEHGREPTDAEILTNFKKWTPQKLQIIKETARQWPLSLDRRVNDDDSDAVLSDFILDSTTPQPEYDVLMSHSSEIISQWISETVPEKFAVVLTLIHGLPFIPAAKEFFAKFPRIEEGREYSTKEIAALLRINVATVREYRFNGVKILSQPQNRQRLQYLLGHTDSPS